MALVAIGWQVYSVRGNPLDLGLIGLAEFVPLLAFAIPAGQLADRLPRKRLLAIMVALDLVVLAGLLTVTSEGADRVWPFFILAFLFGVGSTIGAPAGRALTPSLVPQDLLVRALAQRSIAFQLSRVAGPAVGGLLFTLNAELVYVVALGLTMISLGCILALHAGRVAARRVAPASGRRSQACGSSAGRRYCWVRSHSTSAQSCSAVRSRSSRSSPRTSSRWGRPVSAS
jgi:MFS family permease